MKTLLIINLINILVIIYLLIGVMYAKKKTDDIDSFIFFSLAWPYVIITIERLAKRVERNYHKSQVKNLINLGEYSRIVSNALDATDKNASKKVIDKICNEIDREYINQVAQMN